MGSIIKWGDLTELAKMAARRMMVIPSFEFTSPLVLQNDIYGENIKQSPTTNKFNPLAQVAQAALEGKRNHIITASDFREIKEFVVWVTQLYRHQKNDAPAEWSDGYWYRIGTLYYPIVGHFFYDVVDDVLGMSYEDWLDNVPEPGDIIEEYDIIGLETVLRKCDSLWVFYPNHRYHYAKYGLDTRGRSHEFDTYAEALAAYNNKSVGLPGDEDSYRFNRVPGINWVSIQDRSSKYYLEHTSNAITVGDFYICGIPTATPSIAWVGCQVDMFFFDYSDPQGEQFEGYSGESFILSHGAGEIKDGMLLPGYGTDIKTATCNVLTDNGANISWWFQDVNAANFFEGINRFACRDSDGLITAGSLTHNYNDSTSSGISFTSSNEDSSTYGVAIKYDFND